MHIANILKEKELTENSVVKNYLTTAADGKNYNVVFYSLEMIIAVGYRVRGVRGTQFRQWATELLTEYLVSIVFAFTARKFDQSGEFSHDSTKEMQAFLCIRCSKIWYFAR